MLANVNCIVSLWKLYPNVSNNDVSTCYTLEEDGGKENLSNSWGEGYAACEFYGRNGLIGKMVGYCNNDTFCVITWQQKAWIFITYFIAASMNIYFFEASKNKSQFTLDCFNSLEILTQSPTMD